MTDWRCAPVRRSAALAAYEGEWVAVKDGVVVAHSLSDIGLVPLVRALGKAGEGAVVEFVSPPTAYVEVW